MLWTNQQLSSALGRACHLETGGAEGFIIDSRQVKPGDIFLPLVGTKQDGHDYIEQVINQGAVGSLCLRGVIKNYPTNIQQKLIASDDIMADIIKLARYRRDEIKKNGGKVLAITGSVGKTSVKEMIGHVLEKTGEHYYKSPANQNNTLGVPLCLMNSRADIKAGVYECGMNHQGELLQIGETLRPDIVVITNIRENHIGYLGSLRGIAEAKGELLEHMAPDAPMAILEKAREAKYNFFDFLSQKFKQHHPEGKVVSVGDWTGCDAHLVKTANHLGSGQTIQARLCGKQENYNLNLSGSHQALNSLFALTGLRYLLGPQVADTAAQQLSTYDAPTGRGNSELLKIGSKRIVLIDESYNAAPASMKAALQNLENYVEPALGIEASGNARKIAILGDMKELGDKELEYHKEIVDVAQRSVDYLIFVGDLMRQAWEHFLLHGSERTAVIHVQPPLSFSSRRKFRLNKPKPSTNTSLERVITVDDADQAIDVLDEILANGDIIMVKASHSMGLEKIVKYLQERSSIN